MSQPGDSHSIDDLKLLWESDPSSKVYLQLAEEYRKLGRHPDAIEVLEKSLQHRPRDPRGRVALARCHLETGVPAEAAELLEAVTRRDPEHMDGNKLLLEAYLQLADHDRASERLNIYRLLNDRDPEIDHLEYRLSLLAKTATDLLAKTETDEAGEGAEGAVEAPVVAAEEPAQAVEESSSEDSADGFTFDEDPGYASFAAVLPEESATYIEAPDMATLMAAPVLPAPQPLAPSMGAPPVNDGIEFEYEEYTSVPEPETDEPEPEPDAGQPSAAARAAIEAASKKAATPEPEAIQEPEDDATSEGRPSAAAMAAIRAAAEKAAQTEPEPVVEELGAPALDAPAVSTPEAVAPEVSAPEISVPEVSAPETSVSEVSAPEISVSEISAAPEPAAPEPAAPEPAAPRPAAEESTTATEDLFDLGATAPAPSLDDLFDLAGPPRPEPTLDTLWGGESEPSAEPAADGTLDVAPPDLAESVAPEDSAAESVAETAESVAETAESVAETAESVAETAESVAETAESVAETAESVAETAESVAETAESAATATLGELYLGQGHLDEAEKIFDQVLQQDPENAAAKEGLRKLAEAREQPTAAVAPASELVPEPIEAVPETTAVATPEVAPELADEESASELVSVPEATVEPVAEPAEAPAPETEPAPSGEPSAAARAAIEAAARGARNEVDPTPPSTESDKSAPAPLTAAELLADRSLTGVVPEGLTAKKILVLDQYAKHLRKTSQDHVR